MSVYLKHAKVVLLHKYYVMKECFKAGLYWQGIVHDMSKFSVTEFCASARYFQGANVDSEKKNVEYSQAWLHHKSHNKHHWQYWMDYDKGCLVLERMPPKYLAEMLCDWVGAIVGAVTGAVSAIKMGAMAGASASVVTWVIPLVLQYLLGVH